MQLERAGSGLWEYAERYLGAGTRGYSRFSDYREMSTRYDPVLGVPQFDLASYLVPRAGRSGHFVDNGLDPSLSTLYGDADFFVLPVHPDTLSRLDERTREELSSFDRGPRITVVPSANARTVFVKAIDGRTVRRHFLKLHFPGRLSRFTRRLRAPIIQVQLWGACELARIGCPLLPEVAGGYVGEDPIQAWGYLVRSDVAIGASNPQHVVPLFALYGTDVHAPDDPTLLEQLIERSGEPATQFIGDRVIRPMVRMWLEAAQRTGLVLEMHGQNTLLGFADDGHTVVLYRDCGVYVDPAIRAAVGFPDDLPPTNVISRDVLFAADHVRSLAYDSFMGNHALSPLACVAEQRLGVRIDVLHEIAKDEFRQSSNGERLLPDTVYYYDDQLHPDGGWKLVNTGREPVWR